MNVPIHRLIRWDINACIIRHLSSDTIQKFRDGKYLDDIDAKNGRRYKKGYISWPRTRKLVRKCLNCGYSIHEQERDTGTEPPTVIILETYDIITRNHRRV